MDFYEIMLQQKLAGGGGGGGVTVQAFSVSENGVFSAPSGYAYSPVEVSVPTGVFPSGTKDITSNGIYSVVDFASANVNVPGIVPSGTSSISENGIYDITNFASVDVNVSGGREDIFAHIIDKKISGNIVVPSDIIMVGDYMFSGCSQLTGITFTTSDAFAVRANAFAYCSNISYIDFTCLTNVQSSAFRGCDRLISMIIRGTSSAAPWTYAQTFSYFNSSCNIFVPSSQVSMYKTADRWSAFESRIFAIEDME